MRFETSIFLQPSGRIGAALKRAITYMVRMRPGDADADRLLSAIDARNAASRRLVLERTEENARAFLMALMEEAEASSALPPARQTSAPLSQHSASRSQRA